VECRLDGAAIDAGRPDWYRFNTTIAGIEEADALLVIGSNLRTESPVINARIRKRAIAGGFPVGFVGPRGIDLTYAQDWLGEGGVTLRALAEGTHRFNAVLRAAKRPMLILGRGALAGPAGAAVLATAWQVAAQNNMLQADWHGFNLLQLFGGQMSALDLGCTGGVPADAQVVWSLGAAVDRVPAGAFLVYQGHHGDAAAARADVILPGAAYTEKDATWVNTEGRVQRGRLATYPPGEAKEDWAILRAVSGSLGRPLPFDNLGALRAALVAAHSSFGVLDTLERAGCADLAGPPGHPAAVPDDAFLPALASYWQADSISRASETMAECARVYAPATPALAAE
jgi:NADH-quinone oxidoreductase subunit G